MSVMARRVSVALIVVWALLPAASHAALNELRICGIALGQDSKSAVVGFDSQLAGPVVFIDPRKPQEKKLADRLYLRAHVPCAELADRRDDPDDVPDIVLDVMGGSTKAVVSIAFRPRIRDCETVRTLIGSLLGQPDSGDTETAEWILSTERRRILLTSYDGECWISQQPLSF